MRIKSNILLQYLQTALWSSTGDDDSPLDDKYSVQDIADSSVEAQAAQLNDFLDKAVSLTDDLDLTDVAHDFWLTRNRHGAGFWDGDYPDTIGKALTDLAHSFGEVNAYVGDDGKVYIE